MDFSTPTSIPPGAVPAPLVDRLERIVADQLPPAWADVVRAGRPDGLRVPSGEQLLVARRNANRTTMPNRSEPAGHSAHAGQGTGSFGSPGMRPGAVVVVVGAGFGGGGGAEPGKSAGSPG